MTKQPTIHVVGEVALARPVLDDARFILLRAPGGGSRALVLPPALAQQVGLGDLLEVDCVGLGGPAASLVGGMASPLAAWDAVGWLAVGRVLFTMTNPTRAAPLWHQASKALADAAEAAAGALSAQPKAPLQIGGRLGRPTAEAMSELARLSKAAIPSIPDAKSSWDAATGGRLLEDAHFADVIARLSPCREAAAAASKAVDAELIRTDIRAAVARVAAAMRQATVGPLESIAAPATAMGRREPRKLLEAARAGQR